MGQDCGPFVHSADSPINARDHSGGAGAPRHRRVLGNAIMWMHDAAQLRWLKRVTRSIPWRPEWVREHDGKGAGPASAGVSAPPITATVRAVPGTGVTRGEQRRAAPTFRARLRVARPCRQG